MKHFFTKLFFSMLITASLLSITPASNNSCYLQQSAVESLYQPLENKISLLPNEDNDWFED